MEGCSRPHRRRRSRNPCWVPDCSSIRNYPDTYFIVTRNLDPDGAAASRIIYPAITLIMSSIINPIANEYCRYAPNGLFRDRLLSILDLRREEKEDVWLEGFLFVSFMIGYVWEFMVMIIIWICVWSLNVS